jgi:hypothetical protein
MTVRQNEILPKAERVARRCANWRGQRDGEANVIGKCAVCGPAWMAGEVFAATPCSSFKARPVAVPLVRKPLRRRVA